MLSANSCSLQVGAGYDLNRVCHVSLARAFRLTPHTPAQPRREHEIQEPSTNFPVEEYVLTLLTVSQMESTMLIHLAKSP